jgi:hypothetical protein
MTCLNLTIKNAIIDATVSGSLTLNVTKQIPSSSTSVSGSGGSCSTSSSSSSTAQGSDAGCSNPLHVGTCTTDANGGAGTTASSSSGSQSSCSVSSANQRHIFPLSQTQPGRCP